MQPVSTHGAHKITMNSRKQEDEQARKQALAQADGNPYVTGIEAPSNFSQPSSTANAPTMDPRQTTATADLGTSATEFPEQSPEQFQTEAVARVEKDQFDDQRLNQRLQMIAKAASNADYSLNDRSNMGV
jgi:hypothetical protein|tara:strand:- start:194 stop:583 length:390 start_codon:yes stop_codon:yes gene_type:complete